MKRLLKPWHTLAVLTAAAGLVACEPSTPPAPKMGSAPVANAAPAAPVTDAVKDLSADAATVAASADIAAATPISSLQASPLSSLREYVGTYPSDSNVSFLEQGVLAERLKQLMGKDYSTLLANLRTVSPLTADAGRWFITGNRPHEGGTEAAAVVVDAAQNAVRVWMLHEGKSTEYQDPSQVNVPWPVDVQTMLNNQKGAALKP